MKRIQFSGTTCLSNQVQSAEPLDIFELMFANELVGHITQQTNLYFKENIVGKIFKKHSRIQKHLSSASSKSELCIANEIRLFIASILYRGVDQKPVAHIFYTKNKLFETPGFTKILPQDRLVVSEKYIYFVDISILGESYNRSAKIEPIHEYLVERWQSLLTLEENISVDEALLFWKGCLTWKQFIRTKRARFGLKSFVLAEASSGYVWTLIIYTGDDTLVEEGNTYQYKATNVVMSLCEKVLDKGRSLFVGNWCSSLELPSKLHKRSADVVSTVGKDRKGLPKDVMSKKLKTGEKAIAYNLNYGAICMQWKDKRDVRMLTSCVPDEDVVVKGHGKNKLVPLVVNIYNESMGGVKRSDQMMSSRKCVSIS